MDFFQWKKVIEIRRNSVFVYLLSIYYVSISAAEEKITAVQKKKPCRITIEPNNGCRKFMIFHIVIFFRSC